MEEGGGHGFCFGCWKRGRGRGRRRRRIFFLLVLLFVFLLVGWLVGWLAVFSFLVSCLREVLFLYQLSPIAQNVYTFFFFLFFSLSFFLVELEGWLDYASPGRAD